MNYTQIKAYMSNEEEKEAENQIEQFKQSTPQVKAAFLSWIYDNYFKPKYIETKHNENNNF